MDPALEPTTGLTQTKFLGKVLSGNRLSNQPIATWEPN